MDSKIVSVTLPQMDNLYCVTCKIIINESDPEKIYPKYWKYKLKIRKFLEEVPAIAAPKTEKYEPGFFYVIIAKDFSECFKNACVALNIEQVDQVNPITPSVYKKCLLYTVKYDLEPHWNKVGQYLVEGSDFLASSGSVNAIQLDIINDICDNKAQFHIKALNLKIPFLRLNTTCSFQHDFQRQLRILPSLEFVNVLSISNRFRKHHLFKDYQSLCEYWKDLHGYVLPSYKEEFLFYDIKFSNLSYFELSAPVYPEMCLILGPMESFPLNTDQVSRMCTKIEEDLGRVIMLRNYASSN